MKKLKIATVFSGIGAFEHALDKKKIPYEVMFACDNGERELEYTQEQINEIIANNELSSEQIKTLIDELYLKTDRVNYVEKTYKANYEINPQDYYQDIRFLNGAKYKNKVDIFVGGSPCQSFSISGKRLGLEDARGTLFYEYARLVQEIHPKVFIYENVPGMLSHDNGKTWEIISSIFESLGYEWKLFKLKATDFGIPQNRIRIFVLGFRKDQNIDLESVNISSIPLKTELKDYLESNVSELYYHGEKGFKWITKPLSLKKRVSINGKIARTQAANQQFNWCGDMIFESIGNRVFSDKIYKGYYNGEYGVARKLTPRECLRLMGFNDDFKIVVPDNKMYRQSGNSIVVNILEAIIDSIIETGVFYEKN
ncbi:MAG: DNA cytosine methyltransferase [Erysipelotrichaceae bacterium]|nr:DNA cytosine methyltransferase [Erysipelotrichaceae bacterium]